MSLDFTLLDAPCSNPCAHCDLTESLREIWSASITHNLSTMWDKAGVWEALYKSGGKRAREIAETLERGLTLMRAEPDEFRMLEPENGWGTYEGAIGWLSALTEACRDNPNAIIHVWA